MHGELPCDQVVSQLIIHVCLHDGEGMTGFDHASFRLKMSGIRAGKKKIHVAACRYDMRALMHAVGGKA